MYKYVQKLTSLARPRILHARTYTFFYTHIIIGTERPTTKSLLVPFGPKRGRIGMRHAPSFRLVLFQVGAVRQNMRAIHIHNGMYVYVVLSWVIILYFVLPQGCARSSIFRMRMFFGGVCVLTPF